MPHPESRAWSALRWIVLLPIRVWTFTRAVTGGRDPSLVRTRMDICKACEHVKRAKFTDPDTMQEREQLHCGQCGCGTLAMAELHSKLELIQLRCPLNPPRWGKGLAMTPKEASAKVQQERQAQWAQENPELAAKIEAAKAERAKQRGLPPQLGGVAGTVSQHELHLKATRDGKPIRVGSIPEDEFRRTFRPDTEVPVRPAQNETQVTNST